MSAPMLPAAPGRFSTITGWPHFSESFSATMRGMRSALPPAGNGTTMRTALDRKSTCLNSSHPSISYAVFCLKKKKRADQAEIVDFLPALFVGADEFGKDALDLL